MTFSYFSHKTGFDTSYKLSLKETSYMKCQNLFSGKSKINVFKMLSAEMFSKHAHTSYPETKTTTENN